MVNGHQSERMVLLTQIVCRLRLFDHTRVDLSCVALSREFVENAVRLLVTRLIPLRTSDLQGWISDPEEWVNVEEKEDEQWEFELRVCASPLPVACSSSC